MAGIAIPFLFGGIVVVKRVYFGDKEKKDDTGRKAEKGSKKEGTGKTGSGKTKSSAKKTAEQ